MTESVNGNVLAGNLSVTNGTVNYVVVATYVGTVGKAVVLNNNVAIGMTESVNGNVLTGNLGVTNGTVNYVVVATCIGTVGKNVVFNNNVAIGMTESVNSNVLAGNLGVTNGTVNYVVVATCVGTVGKNVVFNNNVTVGVSKRGNYEIIDNLALSVEVERTSGTGVVAYNTGVKTVGLNTLVPVLAKELVTEFSVNHVLAAKLSVASATVNNIVVVTVENTSRIYGVFNHSLVRCVTELLNYVILIGLTVITGVNGVAVLGTGGSHGSAGEVNVLCGSGNGRGSKNNVVRIKSYNCVGVVDGLFAVSRDLMTGKNIVVCDGVVCQLAITVYSILYRSVNLVPGKFYLATFLVGCSLEIFEGINVAHCCKVNGLRACGHCHSTCKCNNECEHSHEREKLSE